MSNLETIVAWTGLLTGLIACAVFVRRISIAGRVRRRFYANIEPASLAQSNSTSLQSADRGPLSIWLYRAGFRERSAVATFLATTIAGFTFGGLVAVGLSESGLLEQMAAGAAASPGGLGDMFQPFIAIAPWFVLMVLSTIPLLKVRSARRLRVQLIEQDLPVALDLLAALGESGLAFDASITQVFDTRLGERPLGQDFRVFHADLLAGRSRLDAFRRLASAIDVASVTILTSALVQAEQLGHGLAGVLRQQADDLRARRRERANAFASSLPVKLMMPLVICFLPGLFVWTLGPVFLKFFQMADTLLEASTGVGS